ncbi:hypothetical protein FNF29_02536 [Cafeteria roenbergensis]|uniref:Uncharacterized protein n=1 Tax=Cafeteria roenbergensis TaxID=33653 RepID=A0A5A8CSA7_CAFRO|nr:hypothetical protein FNF29_02536 [Cafeteria roenbergensis]KAA0155539.1 hypothetical protein FNF31_06078 [Cafeteria roenbergensis]|eukprot:KAA0154316.1 hypothetical protein FNF29_02536 [Cafeteria roenbergensis]
MGACGSKTRLPVSPAGAAQPDRKAGDASEAPTRSEIGGSTIMVSVARTPDPKSRGRRLSPVASIEPRSASEEEDVSRASPHAADPSEGAEEDVTQINSHRDSEGAREGGEDVDVTASAEEPRVRTAVPLQLSTSLGIWEHESTSPSFRLRGSGTGLGSETVSQQSMFRVQSSGTPSATLRQLGISGMSGMHPISVAMNTPQSHQGVDGRRPGSPHPCAAPEPTTMLVLQSSSLTPSSSRSRGISGMAISHSSAPRTSLCANPALE